MLKLHACNKSIEEVDSIYIKLTKLEPLSCCELLNAVALEQIETILPEQRSLYLQILNLKDSSVIQLTKKIENQKLKQEKY